jgi:hypothetical protein
VIGAIWDGLLALGLGDLSAPRILEPAAGVGRFLGLQPTDSADRSVRTAIELDTLTARLLKAVYPRAAVHSVGFQDAPLRDNSFDVAISNVPFGDFPVIDRVYLKAGERFLTRSVHNYFFIKTLAKLRPGGVLAFITSRYTLDAPTAEPIRTYLHQEADLVAAVRLPAGTFPDTEVVTDLVLLRKRFTTEVPGDDTWVKTISQTYLYQRPQPANARYAPGPEEVRSDLNAYFGAHPRWCSVSKVRRAACTAPATQSRCQTGAASPSLRRSWSACGRCPRGSLRPRRPASRPHRGCALASRTTAVT